MDQRAAYLLVIGEREALAWILRERRMAFPAGRERSVRRLRVGDDLFLTTSRGCYHNPTRDRTLVMGTAEVASPVALLDEPVAISGRVFPHGCALNLRSLAPLRDGVMVAPLVEDLEAFPNKRAWAATLRQTLVALGPRDRDLLAANLASSAGPAEQHVGEYLRDIRPVKARPGPGRIADPSPSSTGSRQRNR